MPPGSIRRAPAGVALLTLAVALALAAGATASQAPSAYRQLLPVDEATKDPSLLTTRSRLIQACVRRDRAVLRAVLAPDLFYSFGGGRPGPDGFFRYWDRQPPQALWEALAAVLALGGTYRIVDGTPTFTAPYVFATWPETLDPFDHVAILGENVAVRARPDLRAPVLTRLSFAIVPTLARDRARWVRVRLADGGVGYVAAEFARSPIDFRAVFQKRGGSWRMTAFVAGD